VTLKDGSKFLKKGISKLDHKTAAQFSKNYRQGYKELQVGEADLPLTLHYSQDMWQSAQTVFARQWTLTMRNQEFTTTQIVNSFIQGILIGTTFWDLEKSDYITRYGLMFTASMSLGLAALAQIPQIVAERTVFYKQREANFFRTQTYVWASLLTQLPMNFLCTTIVSCFVYFMTNMARDAGAFIFFWTTMFFLSTGMGLLFKFFAAALPDGTSAQGMASCMVLLLVLMSGYIVQRKEIKGWFIWLYYINPIQWAYTAMMINEFKSDDYNDLIAGSTKTRGEAYLEAYQLYTSRTDQYIGIICTFALGVVSFFLMWYAYHNISYASGGGADGDEEEAAVTPASTPLVEKPAMAELSQSLLGSESKHTSVDVQGFGNDGLQNGSDLPFDRIELAFKDLTYTVELTGDNKGEKKSLLNGVNGCARPGRLTALMGTSGAGKTTLLDVLAGRKNTGEITGTVTTNGFPKSDEVFATLCGYVEQVDQHSPTSTVGEGLHFSARLRLPGTVTPEERSSFVESWAQRLDLAPLMNQRVGTLSTGGLSIEQRKRLTIGVELVANPSIVFLDEPTSGLDARAAMIVLKALQAIAASGRSVICTIHQPSGELFSAFHDLLLMKTGGFVVYFGELGNDCDRLINYFEKIPGTEKIRDHYNPATWMLEVIGGKGDRAPEEFVALWSKSKENEQAQNAIDEMVLAVETASRNSTSVAQKPLEAREKVGLYQQLTAVISKAVMAYWRSPSYNTFKVFLNIIVGLLVGGIFFNTFDLHEHDGLDAPWNLGTLSKDTTKYNVLTQAKAMSGVSICFLSAAFCGVININTVLNVVIDERSVFYRERASKMYSAFSYSLGMWVAEFPYICVQCLVYVAVAYPMVGFPVNSSADFLESMLKFLVPFTVYLHISTYFGHFIACLAPSEDAANILGSMFSTFWQIFAGFLIAKDKIPDPYLALYYTSPLRYALEPLVASQFWCKGCAKNLDDLNDHTGEDATNLATFVTHYNANLNDGGIPFPEKFAKSLDFPTVFDSTCDRDCSMMYVTSAEGLSIPVYLSDFTTGQFSFEYDNYWTDILYLVAFAILFRIFVALTLRFVNHQKR